MEKQKDLLDALFNDLCKAVTGINKSIFGVFLVMDLVYFMVFLMRNPITCTNVLVYLILYLFRPTFYEVAVLLIGDKYISGKANVKGAGVLLVTELLFGVRLFVHNDFEALYTLMCIPLFLGILYGSKELVERLFYQGLGIFVFDFILIHLRDMSFKTEKFYLNFIIAIVIFCCCFFCARMFVGFEESKEVIIDRYKDEFEVISNEACIDGLTRLYNFKTLSETAEDWIKSKKCVSFCIIDIDDFKKVNDTYGHEFGNVVLKRLSLLLSYRSRENVFVARYGGEEFAILTYEMNPKGVFNMVEKLRRTFRLEEYRETKDSYTFSGGIATYKQGMSVSDLFEAADKKLYFAKHNGKNQVAY